MASVLPSCEPGERAYDAPAPVRGLARGSGFADERACRGADRPGRHQRLARLAIAACTALTVAVWASPVAALTAPASEEYIVAGEEALEEGRTEDAALSFEAGYLALDAKERQGPLGAHLVGEAASAYEAAYRASGDEQWLHRASRLLRTFADERGGSLPTTELRAQLDRLSAVLANLDKPTADPVGPAEPTPAGAESAGPASVGETDRPPPETADGKPDRLGIGLVAGGSVATLGGVGLLVWGSQIPRLARAALADRGGASGQDTAFLDQAKRTQTGILVGGSLALAVGIALVSWGAVRLSKRKAAQRSARRNATRRHAGVGDASRRRAARRPAGGRGLAQRQ